MHAVKRAGAAACLVFLGACAQVPSVPVTPVIATFAARLDQWTAEQITDLDRKQDWQGMLALARAQMQRQPERSDWWFLQGYAHGRLGKPAEAIQSYERAVKLSPEDEPSWLALGHSQTELGQIDRAAQTYRQILRYRPESSHAYLGLAEIYQKQGKHDLAISNYRECVRYDPESAQGWYGLALSSHQTRQNERREEAVRNLRKLAPAIADQFDRQYPPRSR